MRRRRFIGCLAAAATGGLAGCIDRPGRYGGWLYALSAHARPEDATLVPRDDDRIADVEPIQTAIDEIGAGVRVSRDEYRRLSSILEELPYYDAGDRGTGDPMSGYYVEDESVDYWPVLILSPECRDSIGSLVVDERDDRHSSDVCVSRD